VIDGRVVWASIPTTAGVFGAKDGAGESRYVGLFNLAADAQRVGASFTELGLGSSTKCTVTDMWAGRELEGDDEGMGATVPTHGAALLHLAGCQ
jgi:hypothetical protein